MEPSLLLGSSKRARALNNATQVVHCLVDGCNADLSQCREYHRRHKVCEAHSKTPRVTIGGNEQRFCQQCSRFHSLVEFDEGKRSCRKRLDGHNRRRRKPQPDPLSKNSGVISSRQGTRLLSFSGQQILPITAASSTWAGIVKDKSDLVLYNTGSPSNYRSSFPESSSQSYKGICQFDFMQGTEQTLSKAPLCQQLLDPNSEAGNCTSSQSLFRNVLNQVVDSDCACSLLSPAPAIVRETVLPHTWQPPEYILERQSLIDNIHCTSMGRNPFSQDMENAPVIPTGYSNASNSATIHFQGVFQNEPDCSSGSESHQTLTFSWG